MKIVFPNLTEFLAELKARGRQEVRVQHFMQHRADAYGLDHITHYSLVTAEITPGQLAELRIPHGTVAHPLGAPTDASVQNLQAKADGRHQAIGDRLRQTDLIVLGGAYRPDTEVIDGTMD